MSRELFAVLVRLLDKFFRFALSRRHLLPEGVLPCAVRCSLPRLGVSSSSRAVNPVPLRRVAQNQAWLSLRIRNLRAAPASSSVPRCDAKISPSFLSYPESSRIRIDSPLSTKGCAPHGRNRRNWREWQSPDKHGCPSGCGRPDRPRPSRCFPDATERPGEKCAAECSSNARIVRERCRDTGDDFRGRR